MRDGLGMKRQGHRRSLRQMEQGPAQFLPDRDHRRRAGRQRSQDRQADGRHDPRHRRPEGHRPLVGDRGAEDGRAGDRDRGGRRRARSVRDEEAQRVAAAALQGRRKFMRTIPSR